MIPPLDLWRAVGAWVWGTVARRLATVLWCLVAAWGALGWWQAVRERGMRTAAEAAAQAAVAARAVDVDRAIRAEHAERVARTALARQGARVDTLVRVVRHTTTDTLRLTDTVRVREALVACDALASACAAFRDSATVALAHGDSVRAALAAVVAGEADRTRAAVQAHAPSRWRWAPLVVGALAGFWIGRGL